MVQFGISYTSDEELRRFADTTILDDPPLPPDKLLPEPDDDEKEQERQPPPLFREGRVSFAGSGPNSRTSQLFIAYENAGGLGNSPWETPIGEVVNNGMETAVRMLYSGYGDMPPWGNGPQQGPIRNRGASYIDENFPLLDKFETCTVRRLDSSSMEEEDGNAATEADLPADGIIAVGRVGPPPNGEVKNENRGGTRGRGHTAESKLETTPNGNGENDNLVMFVKLSSIVVVAMVVVHHCSQRRRRMWGSSKQAEKRV